jgi:hypothetical protein
MNTIDPPPSAVDLELWHRIETEPEGTFRLFKADGVGTEERIQQHLSNYDEIASRIAHAVQSECLIEVVSLRLQVMDYWMRVYFSNRASEGQTREREFGRLLRQCLDLAMPQALYARLIDFNKKRIDAIHGYVVGNTSYSALRKVAADCESLLRDVVIFVVKNGGTVVTSRDHVCASPGAMVIHLAAFCAEVERGSRY